MEQKKMGRPVKNVHRVTINVSGQPEQIEKLKELAKADGKNVSKFILEKTGVIGNTN